MDLAVVHEGGGRERTARHHQHTQRADELLHRVQEGLQECTVAATPAVVEAEGG